MKRKPGIRGAAAAALCLLLAACGGAAPAASSAPARLEKVRMAYPSRTFSYGLLPIAVQRGFFSKEGLDVELVQMQSGPAYTGLTTGDPQYVATLGSGLSSIVEGQPNEVFLVVVDKPAHKLIVGPSIGNISELRGKVLGLSNPGGTDALVLQQLLAPAGIKLGDVQITYVRDNSARVASLVAGQIVGAPLASPDWIQAVDSGMKVLAESASLNLPQTAVTARKDYVQGHRDQAIALSRALLKALAFVREPRNKDDVVKDLTAWLGQNADVVTRSYDAEVNTWSPDGWANKEGLATVLQSAVDEAKKQPLPLDAAYDESIVKEAQKQTGTAARG